MRFTNAEAAKACVRVMDGRFFSGTRVEAYIADGSERFKKSSAKRDDDDEKDSGNDQERLEKFESWLRE